MIRDVSTPLDMTKRWSSALSASSAVKLFVVGGWMEPEIVF